MVPSPYVYVWGKVSQRVLYFITTMEAAAGTEEIIVCNLAVVELIMRSNLCAEAESEMAARNGEGEDGRDENWKCSVI